MGQYLDIPTQISTIISSVGLGALRAQLSKGSIVEKALGTPSLLGFPTTP